jgi:Zn-finger nucleic acid-binding protein
MVFIGSKFCPHCGTKIERAEEENVATRLCPRCRVPLGAITLGSTRALECPRCSGLWIGTETFNEICADREKQATVIGGTCESLGPDLAFPSLESIHYVPCPVCTKLMNRVNFARSSGVILDICKADGAWFDREELRRAVEFVHAGGLEISRQRERRQWEAAKRRKDDRLDISSVMMGAEFDASAGDFRERLGKGDLLIDALASVARFFLK